MKGKKRKKKKKKNKTKKWQEAEWLLPGGFPLQAKSGKGATVGPLKFELFASGE